MARVKDINTSDMTAHPSNQNTTARPPMLGGERAFGGAVCPWAP